MKYIFRQDGFTLFELVIVIVIIGVMAAAVANSIAPSIDDIKREETALELDMLAEAIVGNPALLADGKRCDFGYIGDIGAFPPNLQALYQNPGGLATWSGPYLRPGFAQDNSGYTLDAWGKTYAYNGISITSSGGPETLIKRLADSQSDYIGNTLLGTIKDSNDSLPGPIDKDSVDIRITAPNGSGATITKFCRPDSAGNFHFDSLPVGLHPIRVVYMPASDTLFRFVTILPRNRTPQDFKFAADYFSTASNPTGTDSSMIAHYMLDENSGTTASDDVNGYDGTLIDMNPASDWVAGKIGNALSFDGVNDLVEIPHNNDFDLSQGFTICGWFKMRPQDKQDYRTIVAKSISPSNRNWWICVRQNGTIWWKASYGGTELSINPNGNVANNNWHHFAAVYDGDADIARLYVDGSLPSGGTVPGVPDIDTQVQSIQIGSEHNTRYFKGEIDDIRIYNWPLSAADIAALAN